MTSDPAEFVIRKGTREEGDLGGKNLRDETQETCVYTVAAEAGVFFWKKEKISETLMLPSRVRHPVEIVHSMIYKVFVKFSF